MPKVLRAPAMNKCLGCFTCMTTCAAVNQKSHSLPKAALKIRTTGGIDTKYVAFICMGCKAAACREACPSGALTAREGGGVVLDPEKCIGCRQCEQACIAGAINFDQKNGKPIICRQCGICARFCPHDCLAMTEVTD